jgi:uncharacterized membrane-anchored protein
MKFFNKLKFPKPAEEISMEAGLYLTSVVSLAAGILIAEHMSLALGLIVLIIWGLAHGYKLWK